MKQSPNQLQPLKPLDNQVDNVAIASNSESENHLLQSPDFDARVQSLATQNQNNAGNLYRGLGRLLGIIFRQTPKNKQVDDAQNYYKKGLNFAIEGLINSDSQKHLEALECYNEAIKLNPNDSRVWYERGLALNRLGRYQEALDNFNNVLTLDPSDSRIFYERGLALSRLKNYQEALDNFNNAIKLYPNDHRVFCERAIVYSHLGEYQKALDDFKSESRYNPFISSGFYERGITHSHLGKYSEAINFFDDALKLNPNDYRALYGKGFTYGRLGQHNDALRYFNEALKLNPSDYESIYERAIIHRDMGNLQQALNDFNKLLELNPNDHRIYRGMALGYSFGGLYKEALDNYSKALELKPQDYDMLYQRGSINIRLGNHLEAISDYNRAIDLNPNQPPELFWDRGIAYSYLKQHQEALDDFNKAVELGLNNNGVFYEIGNIHNIFGRYQEALDNFNKISPGFIYDQYFSGRGVSNMYLGKYQEAIDDFDRALKSGIIKNPIEIGTKKIFSHLQLGQYDKATNHLFKIKEKHPFFSMIVLFTSASLCMLVCALCMLYNNNPVINDDIDDIINDDIINQVIANRTDVLDYKQIRTNIKSTVIPFLSYFIEEHLLNEEEKERLRKVPSQIAGEIFDKISGYDTESNIVEFINNKLDSVDDLEEKNKLQEYFMLINQALKGARLVRMHNELPYNAIYNATKQTRFIERVFEKVIKIFDEEVPKYLKAKHQELLDNKQATSSTVSQPSALALDADRQLTGDILP